MGTKKVKAIVIDKDRMPPLHDLKKYMEYVIEYNKYLGESAGVEAFSTTGTSMVGDLTNQLGGIPVRNFTSGRASGPDEGPFKLGGNYIRELNAARGGEISHACMRGCKIKCSNVFVDENGEELVSPLEYENIGLMGTNCGLTHPDQVARMNKIANDLGVDTIELGVTIAILMDAGKGDFGDTGFMTQVMADLHEGNENGRLYAQGAARVGAHLGMKRVPVIKKQAISAYDPRVIEGTGVSMMLTAQGADHTVGNLPSLKTSDLSVKEIVQLSVAKQADAAIADSLGLCLFGRDVTDAHLDLIANAINVAHDCDVDVEFIQNLGREVLRLETLFNKEAGFEVEDDALPDFFHHEPLDPTGKTARLEAQEINRYRDEILGVGDS